MTSTSLGIAARSLARYARQLSSIRPRFLSDRFGTDVRLGELQIHDIHAFLLRHVQTKSRGTAQCVVTALRSFLRYLQQEERSRLILLVQFPRSPIGLFRACRSSSRPARSSRCSPPATRHSGRKARLRDPDSPGAARSSRRRGRRHDPGRSRLGTRRDRRSRQGARLARLPLPADVGEALVDYLRRRGPLARQDASSSYTCAESGFVSPRPSVRRSSRAQAGRFKPAAQGRAPAAPFTRHRLLRRGASLVESRPAPPSQPAEHDANLRQGGHQGVAHSLRSVAGAVRMSAATRRARRVSDRSSRPRPQTASRWRADSGDSSPSLRRRAPPASPPDRHGLGDAAGKGEPAQWRRRRLAMVRRFASIAAAIEHEDGVPPPDLLLAVIVGRLPHTFIVMTRSVGCSTRQSDCLRSTGLRPQTYATLFGLYAATGMRCSEAAATRSR